MPDPMTSACTVTLQAAKEDTQFLFSAIEAIHPQPLARQSADDYLSLKATSDTTLGEMALNGMIDKKGLTVYLAEVAASIGDVHTDIRVRSADLEGRSGYAGPLMLPFTLGCCLGHLTVDASTGPMSGTEGWRIRRIQKVPWRQFLKPVLRCVPGEREEVKIALFVYQQRDYLALTEPVKRADLDIEALTPRGDAQSITVPLIPLEEYDTSLASGEVKSPCREPRLYHGKRTCYWRIDSFRWSDNVRSQVDQLFGLLEQHGTEHLIIDLRYNGGGNQGLAEYILAHLTSEPYRLFSGMETRISDALLYRDANYEHYRDLVGLTICKRDIRMETPRRVETRFGGCVYLIVGSQTMSTAGAFANVVKDFCLGTLVGGEVGQNRACFGNSELVALPRSGIELAVSSKRFYPPKLTAGDADHGTVPDILLDWQAIDPWLESPDPVLAYVVDLTARN